MASPEILVAALAGRLAARGVRDVRPLAGGASSLTFSAMIDGDERVVIKVAPPGLEPVLHRDVLRQARLLRSLHDTGVAVPRVLWEDRGEPPEVPPLFVMSFVAGTSLEPLYDLDGASGDGADDGVIVAERLANAAAMLATLHTIDPSSLGLDDEPRLTLGAEVERWSRLLATVDQSLVPRWEEAAAALRSVAVTPVPDAVVHGDFRLGNLLATGTEIRAIIDWEIWSVGDPRIDLGWFLVNADPATYRRPTRYVGALPRPAELAEIYAHALHRDVPDLDVFQALACFKSTATWSLIVKHNRRRARPAPELEAMAPTLAHLLRRAHDLLP